MERRRTESVATSNCSEVEEEEKQTPVVHLLSSIVLDILSRLPTRTLLNCGCVCKNWQYLILQDPYFTRIRLARVAIVDDNVIPVGGSLYLLELGEDSNYVHRTHWPIRFKIKYNIPKETTVLGSSNGLFCLRYYSTVDNTDTLYISNPILGECVALPQPKTEAKDDSASYMFGFSPTRGHYKVLRFKLVFRLPTSYSDVEVYTLGTDTWRNVGDAPYPDGCDVDLNGAVNWMNASVATSELIYSFDIGEEQVRTISPPPELRNTNTYMQHEMELRVL